MCLPSRSPRSRRRSAASDGRRRRPELGGSNFNDPHFKALGIKRARVVTPWNVALSPGNREWLDEYLFGARVAGVEPLVSFGARGPLRCPKRPCKLPTTAEFTRAFRAFRARWPWVRTIGVWNEANHRSQPTFRYPEQAGRYFNIVKQALPRLPDRGGGRHRRPEHGPLARTLPAGGARRPPVGTPQLPGQQPAPRPALRRHEAPAETVRGKVWLTETGGIVRFVLPDGRTLFPYSERRANVAIGRVLRLAGQYRSRIERLYVLPLASGRVRQPLRRGPSQQGWQAARQLLHAGALAEDALVHNVTSGWRVRRCSPSVSRTQRRSSALAIR